MPPEAEGASAWHPGPKHDDYRDSFLASGTMSRSSGEALDCACGRYLNGPSSMARRFTDELADSVRSAACRPRIASSASRLWRRDTWFVVEADMVEEAIREAAGAGWVCVRHALAAEDIDGILNEASALTFEPMKPEVGRVRQGGTVARVSPSDTRLPQLGSLSQTVTQGIRFSGVGGAAHFSANEAMYQCYYGTGDGVSVHRDQSFYRVAVVVFTLQGQATFSILDFGTQLPMKEWVTEPGEMCLLAGGGLTERDRRPLHRVGAPVGSTRVSLTIRMKAQ